MGESRNDGEAGTDELRREIAARAVPTENSWWGFDVIRIVDPDGNELLFPLDETNDREYATRPPRPLNDAALP